MERTAKIVIVIFLLILSAMLITGFIIKDSRLKDYKDGVKKEQTFYEEIAQPRIYVEPGVHEAPTYHLQAHHDQILLKLRDIETKLDVIIEYMKEKK